MYNTEDSSALINGAQTNVFEPVLNLQYGSNSYLTPRVDLYQDKLISLSGQAKNLQKIQ